MYVSRYAQRSTVDCGTTQWVYSISISVGLIITAPRAYLSRDRLSTSDASVYNKMGGVGCLTVACLGLQCETKIFISAKLTRIAGLSVQSAVVEYCLALIEAVQHLPTLPKRLLHKNLNFPIMLAAFFLARCCLGQVPGGAPFSQRSERATAYTNRMQINKYRTGRIDTSKKVKTNSELKQIPN